ncbi:hypothetical protein F2P81_003767 [Scophthalmus maximus]|uniref:Uncharacterized protein n=1 Tax=Scophthalmus maximus TaxID=52904 RepID=A0A6A4TIE0_SCOMX|nr:hypothetical protein F2P81_003767 [Scophthalmus maximus]
MCVRIALTGFLMEFDGFVLAYQTRLVLHPLSSAHHVHEEWLKTALMSSCKFQFGRSATRGSLQLGQTNCSVIKTVVLLSSKPADLERKAAALQISLIQTSQSAPVIGLDQRRVRSPRRRSSDGEADPAAGGDRPRCTAACGSPT